MRYHYWIFNTRTVRDTFDSFARRHYVSSLWPICVHFVEKNANRDQNCSFNCIFNVQGCTQLIFTYVPYIVIGLHEEPENLYKEKRSVAFVTGHLFTFLVVFSLIGLVTTQILICDNQIIWRLKNSIKNDCGRFVKNQNLWPLCLKQKISRNGQEIFHNSANDRERWGLLIFCC